MLAAGDLKARVLLYCKPKDGSVIPLSNERMKSALQSESLPNRAHKCSDLVNKFAVDRHIVPAKILRKVAKPPRFKGWIISGASKLCKRLKAMAATMKLAFVKRLALMDVLLRIQIDNEGETDTSQFVMPVLAFGAGTAGIQVSGILWILCDHAKDWCADAI